MLKGLPIDGGIEQVRRCDEQIKLIREQITLVGRSNKKITIWGVTDLLRSLIDDYSVPDSTIVVDSDPRRKDHLKEEGVSVLQPKDSIKHIKQSELLVICAPRYRSEILEWILQHASKTFSGKSLVVLGEGSSGETLR